MNTDRRSILTPMVVVVLVQGTAACAAVVLETRDLRLTIDSHGRVRRLVAKASGREYCHDAGPIPAFTVARGDREFPASSAVLTGRMLRVGFGPAGVSAELEVSQAEGYVALKLRSVAGGPIDRIDLLRLRVRPLRHRGTWVNMVYDEAFGICLCAGTKETDVGMSGPGKNEPYVDMRATAHKSPGLAGTVAVLFGCPDPKRTFLDTMAVVERDFKLPDGATHRRSPACEYSYLWVRPTVENIHTYIRWAKRGGFRMILFSYTSFTTGAGHFEWNASYPNGMADLQKVTDAIRAAGLAVGLHIHYNKAHKRDRYVTPVPDERLHRVRVFTLASAVDNKADVVPVNEDPTGCTLDDQRRILKVGKELVAYQAYTAQRPFRFTGCERGHLNTRRSAHRAGERVGLLNVDTWPIFIRFDQDTDIQEEAARRIAAVYRRTGPYAMVYFDGAEDVHAPYWYHVANAQHRVYRHLDPPPPVCEAAAHTHFSWHMITRSNAYDSVAPAKMKAFCRQAPCRGARRGALNFSRVNFGWLHGFARGPCNYISPDILEYVLSRGAAWDCPFSMTVSTGPLALNPRTEDCFDITRIWEDARIENRLTDAQRRALQHLDQEHHLFINEQGRYELVPIRELPAVAGGQACRAYAFTRKSRPGDTYVLVWGTGGEVDLTLDVPAARLTVMRPFGTKRPVSAHRGRVKLVIGDRCYLVLAGMDVARVTRVLRNAQSVAGTPVVIYRRAQDFTSKVGQLALTSEIGRAPKGALGDCIVPAAPVTLQARRNWYVDYSFPVPRQGRWYLWARMKYTGTDSNSFFAGLPDQPEARARFGNSYVWNKWLWEPGPMVFRAHQGRVRVRLYAREAAPNTSPLLDVLCLTSDPGYRPSDERAAQAVGK